MTEQEIIHGLKQKDAAAFAALITQCQNMVYNTALGILQNEDDADDTTQEVFIKAHDSIAGFKEQSSLATWLYRITINKSLDHLRARQRKSRWLMSTWFGSNETAIEATEFNHPGVQLERKEDAAKLFKTIKKLPENQMIAFVLQKTEGLAVAEIAKAMDMNITAVESLLARAKANLRKWLKE